MKKALVTLGVVTAFSGAVYHVTSEYKKLNLYPAALEITACNDHSFEAVTSTGFLYCIHEDPEDLMAGDIISVTMYENGTPNDITDDIVIDYRYSGYYMSYED